MKRAKILLKNVVVNFLTQALTFLVSFIATPYIFHNLGEEKFGLLMLFVTINGWFVIFDLGMIPAMIKYLAEILENKKKKKELVNTAWTATLLIVLAGGGLVAFFADFLIKNVFKVSLEIESLAIMSLRLMSISFVFTLLSNFLTGIPRAMQKFEIANLKNLFLGLFIPLGSVILLFSGFDFSEVIWVYICTNFFAFVIFLIIANKLLGEVNIGFGLNKKVLKKILSFSFFKFISRLTARVNFQLNHFLIASFLSVSQLGFYAVPAGIGEKLLSVLPNLTLPIFPLASELEKGGEKENIKKLYKEAVRLSNFLMTPVFIFLVFFGPEFLEIWMGEDFARNAGLVLQILSFVYLLSSYPAVPAAIIEGSGKPQLTAFWGGVNTVLLTLSALILIPHFGLVGAAGSMLFSRVIQVPLFIFWITYKEIGIKKLRFFWDGYAKILILSVISAAIVYSLPLGQNTLFRLVISLFIYLIIGAFFSYITNTIGKRDIKTLKQILNK